MSRRPTFDDIATIAAAKRCRDGGMPAREIARQAKVSVSTVYRWLRLSEGRRP